MKIPRASGAGLYWFGQRLRGRGAVRSRLELLRHTQTLDAGELADLQQEKLRDLISHACATVPYYRDAFHDLGLAPADVSTIEDLAKLPLLTRDVLLANQAELLSSEADHATLQVNHSSGSTGQRAQFVQDLDFRSWMRAHQLRTYEWCAGWQLGEPFVLLWGSEIYWSLKQGVDRLENLVSNRREFNSFVLSPELIDRFLDRLVDFGPSLISTYSNAMHLIARRAEERDVRVPALRAIQGTSEPLPPALRTRIEEALGCTTYDKYGMRETNIVSHEGPARDGMLIQAENVVVEILGEDGSPCADGEVGNVVVTTLNNRSMPLIRYRTSDRAAFVAGRSSDGLPFPRMTSVAGREQDLIVSPRGDRIDAYLFSYLFMRLDDVHWFQVHQNRVDALRLRLYCPGGLSDRSRKVILERIPTHTGFDFRLDLEVLDRMPESPTGKYRLCVSEVAAGPWGAG